MTKKDSKQFDPIAFGARMADRVKLYVTQVTAPLEARIEALEAELRKQKRRASK